MYCFLLLALPGCTSGGQAPAAATSLGGTAASAHSQPVPQSTQASSVAAAAQPSEPFPLEAEYSLHGLAYSPDAGDWYENEIEEDRHSFTMLYGYTQP